MEKYLLTEEAMLGADTYLPLAEREEFLSRADRCFDRLSIKNGENTMPPMWKENYSLKARYLLAALLGYLKIPFSHEGGDKLLITTEDFDKYEGSHIVAQVERFKRHKDETVRNAAYELMGDYFKLEKAFAAEIRALLDVQNDAVVRQQLLNREAMAELPAALEQLKGLMEAREAAAKAGGEAVSANAT